MSIPALKVCISACSTWICFQLIAMQYLAKVFLIFNDFFQIRSQSFQCNSNSVLGYFCTIHCWIMFICVHLFSLPSQLNSDKTCLQCLFCYFISAVYIQYWGLFKGIIGVQPTSKHNWNHPDWYHHHHHQELFWWVWCGDQCLDLRMLRRQKPINPIM